MATNFARVERSALADLLIQIGPEQPTLCEGWLTRDLAAHIVVRDRRPDSAPGTMIKAFAGHTDKLRNKAAAQTWEVLVEQLRTPPRFSAAGLPPLDRLINTAEFFIHHEDARRAQPDWEPRPLPEELGRTLLGQVKLTSRMGLRKFPAKIKIIIPGYAEPLSAGAGGEELELTGDPGELTMFLSGRQEASRVTITGPDALAAQLRTKKMGV